MLVRQFNIKGKHAEMFDFVKRVYTERLQKDVGMELYIPNNQIIETLIEKAYSEFTANIPTSGN